MCANNNSSLYFNNAFSKQPLREVADAMQPYLREKFHNPLTESEGAESSRRLLHQTRQAVASLIEATPSEIYFVSCGTEANNWALKGTAQAQKTKRHMVISAIEHFSVYQTAQYLQKNGFDLTIAPVDGDGRVDLDAVASAVRPTTFLISIQAGSDEIGVVQDLQALADLKRKFEDVLFHTDAVQFLCYETISVKNSPFDLVSISSNALYGPAGIGALFVRAGTRIVPLLHGGMQEEGLRPGAQSLALLAGFGESCRICLQRKAEWKTHLNELRSEMFRAMDSLDLRITGSRTHRLVDNIHVVASVDGEAVLTLLQEANIFATSGSTCYQYAQKESHVLKALGLSVEQARGALLFTLDLKHSRDTVARLQQQLGATLTHLRRIAPD